jgi:hypothetical protein
MTFNELLLNKKLLNWESEQKVWKFVYLGLPVYHSLRPLMLSKSSMISLSRKINILQSLIDLSYDIYFLIKNFKTILSFHSLCSISYRYQNFEATFGRIEQINSKDEKNTLIFISDLKDIVPYKNKESIILSENIILWIRIFLYVLHLPLILVINSKFSQLSLNINLYLVSNGQKRIPRIKLNFWILKSCSDILFAHIISNLFKKIIVSGGPLPRSITYIESHKGIEELSHGFIGYGHLQYTEIPVPQIPLINLNIFNYKPNNRIVEFSNSTFQAMRFKYSVTSNIGYFPSTFRYHLRIPDYSRYTSLTIFEHPKVGGKMQSEYLRIAICEPSSVVLELIQCNIPVIIVCDSVDFNVVLEYFKIKENVVTLITPENLNNLIKDLM